MNTPTILTQPITPDQLQPLLDKEILFHASYSMGTATGSEQVFTQAGYLKRISPSGQHLEIVIGVSESWVPLEKITMIELLESVEHNIPKPPESDTPCVICGQEITTIESYGVGSVPGVRYHWDCIRRESATVSPDFQTAIEAAWGIIANAGNGDWTKETTEWQKAAKDWRDIHYCGTHTDPLGDAERVRQQIRA